MSFVSRDWEQIKTDLSIIDAFKPVPKSPASMKERSFQMTRTILTSGLVLGAAAAMTGCAAQSHSSTNISPAQKAMVKAQSAQRHANRAQKRGHMAIKRANNAQNTAQKALNTSKANSKRMKRMFKQSQEK